MPVRGEITGMTRRKFNKFDQPLNGCGASRQTSLHDVMNDLARGVGVEPDAPEDDLESFAAIDPLYAQLHREYLQAKSQHDKLVRDNGADDPMADIAADMADSAMCARDTRFIELRRMEASVQAAARESRARRDDAVAMRAAEKRQYALDVFYRGQIIQRMKDRRRERDSDMTLLWMMLFIFLGIGPFKPIRPMASTAFNRYAV